MNTKDNVIFDLTSSDSNISLKIEQDVDDPTKPTKSEEVQTTEVVEPKRESIEERLASVQEMLASLKLTVASAIQEVKQIDKAYTKEKKRKFDKEKDVTCANNPPKDGVRKSKIPSGFARPVGITDELCIFMNVKEGTKVARTEVTRFLNKYIADNQLQNKQAKTKINADESLKNLLRLGEQDLTYFNLQKYMNQHFI